DRIVSSDVPSTSSPAKQAGQVLYRKWRPQTFAEVVGQEPVTRTLRNSVATKRIAHAYLLSGPRGTGKTSLGRLIAKAANCENPGDGEPCNECGSCRAFLEGRAIDFIEQDAASHNSVDDIRQLRENVVLNPMSGAYKVYLLDEVHMLSGSAENALLKTLEEPPPHIIFVLATTDPHKVSATIISRCQRFDLRRIPTPAVAERLAFICDKEGFTLDEVSLQEVARSAGGSLRDAINGLEQIVTYYGASPSPEQVQEALGISVDARSAQLARLLLADPSTGSLGEQAGQALAEGLKLVAAVRDDGVDMRRFSREVVGYLRELLLVKAGVADTLDQSKETLAAMQALAKQSNRSAIVSALKAIGRLDFRDDPQSSLPLELALVDLVTEAEKPVERPAAAAEKAVPAPTEPEPQPQFSIPASSAEEVAATATGATVGAPEPEAAEAAPAPTPAGAPADVSTGSGQAPSTAGEASIAPTAGSPSPDSSGEPAKGTDQALLTRIRNACKESDKQLAALLNASCEVTSLEEDVLTLGFYHTFHLERMEAGSYANRLSELLSQELGRPMTVKLVHSPRRPTPGKVKSGRLVQAAQELGAKPIGKEEHDDS
ncbi:MAG: DNA polymerase III subunit gamma/tau, partial [Chloroflexi bacterium]|nr:DNA polymerase III subunit gamma/tau [Chloroflexota bacterium]